GAKQRLLVPPGPNGSTHDLQGIDVQGAVAGAIAKAVTGAYLSSAGNAFSTRTASMIVQEHFPPSAVTPGLESGPLFGVQFSSLPCSDLSARFGVPGPGALVGPKRSPLGLAADPGGFPLYRNGVVIGGVGIMADGQYGFDPEVRDVDNDAEEAIALAATRGYEAPVEIRAERVSVDGTLLRYSDADPGDFASGTVLPFAAINGTAGVLRTVRGYYDSTGGILAGAAYGTEASGVRPANPAEFSNSDAFVLTDGAGSNRFPIRGGTETGIAPLSGSDVRALLEEAFTIMTAARAQIRRPLDSRAQVTISVVDTNGAVLGIVRSPDAPIFGIDVSLQKARTAMFFSHPAAETQLLANPDADVRGFVAAQHAFFGSFAAFSGQIAWSARAIGNIHRPYFPDGEVGRPPGPLSRAIAEFNPFSTGLQSALIEQDVRTHVGFILGGASDVPQQCGSAAPGPDRTANGIQIFPGGVPIYRNGTLVGGIGVSGDGIDQDDMISFLGAHNGGVRTGFFGNADPAIRSDQVVVRVGGNDVRLRYVGCPFAPFLGSDGQNVCQGR
ncbi:MAG TPA: heme-binding protein, partial [Allosphingosinicella sp.]